MVKLVTNSGQHSSEVQERLGRFSATWDSCVSDWIFFIFRFVGQFYSVFIIFPFSFFLVKDVLSNSKSSLREKLEEIFKLMLVVWCRQCEVNRLVALEPCGNIFHINTQQNLIFPYVFTHVWIYFCLFTLQYISFKFLKKWVLKIRHGNMRYK